MDNHINESEKENKIIKVVRVLRYAIEDHAISMIVHALAWFGVAVHNRHPWYTYLIYPLLGALFGLAIGWFIDR